MPSEIKPICGLERVKLSEAIPLTTPFSLFVFPTTLCNFKCSYCAHSLGRNSFKSIYDVEMQNMSMETYGRVLHQAKQFPDTFKMLSLTGHGEPLLNRNLSKMIQMAKQSKIAERIEIITNASLLTHQLSDELIDAGLDTLRISLQGLSTEKYKEICAADINFEELIENINYFYNRKRECSVFVKILDVSLEAGEEELFYKIFSDISDRMYIEKCRPVYDGVDYGTKSLPLEDRYGRKHEKRDVCPFPFFMLGIFPNGDVEPCDALYKPVVLGNVNSETLLDMWYGEKLNSFRILQLNKQRNITRCALCCAPDDVAHPEDVLDYDTDRIKAKLIMSERTYER